MKRLYLLSTMMLVVMVAILPQTVKAQISVWDGTTEIWTQGSGTQANPYLIQNAQQFAYIAEMVNTGITHYDNSYFKLTTDIRIDSATVWYPIGLNDTCFFSGHLDGDNHTITLYTYSYFTYTGICGYVKNASIENLEIGGEILQHGLSYCYVGGVAGMCEGATNISNCHNTARIGSYYSNIISPSYDTFYDTYNGGIVGSSSTTTNITNCSNSGSVFSSSIQNSRGTFDSHVGGIVGLTGSSSHILNCYNTGNISSYTSLCYNIVYIGGIVGFCYYSSIISNCYNTGAVSSSKLDSYYNTGLISRTGGIAGECHGYPSILDCFNIGSIISNATGGSDVGGIVGGVLYSVTISNCYNTGDVVSSTISNCNKSCAGGVLGICEGGSFDYDLIKNCYNTGNVSSSSGYISYSGGILGYESHSSVLASNCYNVGTVTGMNKGGIQGNANGIITNCHYLNTCGGTVEGGTSQSETLMKSQSFPVVLNTDSVLFVKDCTPYINQGYPVFGRVSTLEADSIGYTTAVIFGDCQMPYSVDVYGFEYKKTSENNYTTLITSRNSPVSELLTNLQNNTQYTYRFFVQKDGMFYRGVDKLFHTLQCDYTVHVISSADAFCDGDTVIYTAIVSSSNPSTYQYEWNTGEIGNTIFVTDGSTYTVTVVDDYGCAVVDSLYLTVNYGTHNVLDTTVCESFTWADGTGETYTVSDTYTLAYTNENGCASVDTLHLTVHYGTHNVLDTMVCESFTWMEGTGETYTQTGTYTYEYTNNNGCASVDTLHLTVNYSTHNVLDTTVCESFTWAEGTGEIYNQTGTYTYEYTNNDGCASVDTLLLTVNYGTHNVLDTTVCVSFTWAEGTGETYTQTGTYINEYTNNNGCASVDTLYLTVYYGTHNVLDTTVCESFTWTDGTGETYTQTGTYTYEYTNNNGCASVDTLHLTVNYGTHNVLDTTVCESFTWTDGTGETYNISGTYTHAYTNEDGCASVDTLHLTVNQTYNVTEAQSICESELPYTWNGVQFTSAGSQTLSLQSVIGCDSVVTMTLNVLSTDATNYTEEACDSYAWNGEVYSNSGNYTQTFNNAAGCDSVVTLHLTIYESTFSDFTIVINEPCYVWNGIEYCETGDYVQTLQTVDGCDSVVTLHLTIETGINDLNQNASMKVYPNPTSNIVNVELSINNGPSNNVAIQVFDIYGKLLDVVNVGNTDAIHRVPTGHSVDSYGEANAHDLSAQTTQIDLSRYANGVYFIKAVAEGNMLAVRKVVKNR